MKKHIKSLKRKLKIFDPKLKEECGVFGISNAKDASALTALGLHALQHRGQEGCGIVTFDGEKYYSEKRFGLVGDNFNKEKVLNNLKGNYAIGHNRYSTTGNNICFYKPKKESKGSIQSSDSSIFYCLTDTFID